MLNIIRTASKRIRYCGRTVDALIESNRNYRTDIQIISQAQGRSIENTLNQLQAGLDSGCEWFNLLEDDIDFCADFDRSVELWVRDCEGSDSLCYPLGAAYPCTTEVRGISWRWPLKSFYGTQAMVFQRDRAQSLLDYLKKPDYAGHEFDLQIKDWAIKNGATHFLTPIPSFVQHIGVESSLHATNRFHWFPAFAGRKWSYADHSSAFSPKEGATHKFDPALAQALKEHFADKHRGPLVYDLGCGRDGKYVDFLNGEGMDARGMDATPGCEKAFIEEVDLSRDQKFNDPKVAGKYPKGAVLCLEVAEHIPAASEAHLLKNINDLCGNMLVLSWAIPGQNGNRHVNEKDEAYVVPKLNSMGFTLNKEATDKLRASATISWFKRSLYAFQRG